MKISIPVPGDYADYYSAYISLVSNGEITDILESQFPSTLSTLRGIPEEKSTYRYEEGKWSIKEVVGHLIDTERVMSFRAMSFARGDVAEIAGMDQDQYVEAAEYDNCSFKDLIDEFEATRKSNVFFFRHLPHSAWQRSGIASGHRISVAALAYIIAGHEIHHMNLVQRNYI